MIRWLRVVRVVIAGATPSAPGPVLEVWAVRRLRLPGLELAHEVGRGDPEAACELGDGAEARFASSGLDPRDDRWMNIARPAEVHLRQPGRSARALKVSPEGPQVVVAHQRARSPREPKRQ